MRKTYSYRPNGPYYEGKEFWKRLGLDIIRPWRLFGFNPFQWRLFWFSMDQMFPYRLVVNIRITRTDNDNIQSHKEERHS